jgi:tetratricopeptide (TPR) repeat protein
MRGMKHVRSALVAVVACAASGGCDNVGPPPTGAKIVRVTPQSEGPRSPSVEAPAVRASAGAASQAPPLPEEMTAMTPVPGCECGAGYYPVATAEPFYQASLTATREGRFGDALDSASRADSVGMGLDTYRNQLAIALFNAGRAEEALAKWSEIAQGSPGGCELGFYADALIRLERHAEAEPIARRYVNRCPRSSSAHYLLAASLNRLGKWEEADQLATESIRLASDDPSAYHLRSIVREKRNLLDAALSDARTAVKLKPDDGDYHRQEASVLWEMGRYLEARQPISVAAKRSPKDAGIHYFRSMILEKADELDGALQAAKDAVEIDSNNPSYLRQLGELYEALERPAEAIQALDRSLALEFSPGALYSRAMCHNKIGQRRAALRDLRELERKSPGFLNTRDWIDSLEGQ